MSLDTINIALIGNPNAGKTSVFNQLTGLNQKVGNFAGVTMDKVSGSFTHKGKNIEVIDLPGTYSIYPRTMDERVVFNALSDPQATDYPDTLVVIADASNLERNLLLFSQVKDLGIPVVLVLSMLDIANKNGLNIDISALEKEFDTQVVSINGRTGQGLEKLKDLIIKGQKASSEPFYDTNHFSPELIPLIKEEFKIENDYVAYQYAQQSFSKSHLTENQIQFITDAKVKCKFSDRQYQTTETVDRYQLIREKLKSVIQESSEEAQQSFTDKLDKVLTHKVYGYAIFLSVLFLLFQAIFTWSEPFMDIIDVSFAKLSSITKEFLPENLVTDILSEAIIPGLGGIVIFVPQVALLFFFIAILEESGYMTRAVFLTDKVMRQFGLSGKSIVPLISGVACSIPAIMATRSIESWKDRIITIFVTPFMSCAARLPVYATLIALVVPNEYVFGFLNLQGLALMGLYFLGFFGAILTSLAMQKILKVKQQSYFIMELPIYRWPKWSNVMTTIFSKSKTFVFEAGKVIIGISIILWVLATYGIGDKFNNAASYVQQDHPELSVDSEEYENALNSYKLEHSLAGTLGKAIEPTIRPLGYDWKIGIALITSFAAREVFVGTIATIYSVGADDEATLKERLQAEINPHTGQPMYSLALGISLMVFYVFAMQCMSTLAVVKRETKSWKWPMLQLVYMSVVAYLSALVAYQLLA